jgi:hypothetical protein
MEQELKEVDGVAGVASETSLSILPSLFSDCLDFCDLLNLSKKKKIQQYNRRRKKKKRRRRRIILLSVTANQLGRVDSLPILLGFRAFCSAYFWRENDKKRERKKKREQMTRMAVSCRARLYGYFRSKQPCGRVNGRSTW